MRGPGSGKGSLVSWGSFRWRLTFFPLSDGLPP